MEKSIKDITEYRSINNDKCYLVEKNEGGYFVISGSYCRDVMSGDLFDIITLYKNEIIKSWSYIASEIKSDRENGHEEGSKSSWTNLNNEVKERTIDVSSLYVDGVKTI